MSGIIIAPHVDDEVIGCYEPLRVGTISHVYYMSEVDKVREREAYASCSTFGCTAHTPEEVGNVASYLRQHTWFTLVLNKVSKGTELVYLPSAFDTHPMHKYVNAFFRSSIDPWRLRFYSVDMNVPGIQMSKYKDIKQRDLYALFPSQMKLFEQDSKYFLFESVTRTDAVHSTYKVMHVGDEPAMAKVTLSRYGKPIDQVEIDAHDWTYSKAATPFEHASSLKTLFPDFSVLSDWGRDQAYIP